MAAVSIGLESTHSQAESISPPIHTTLPRLTAKHKENYRKKIEPDKSTYWPQFHRYFAEMRRNIDEIPTKMAGVLLGVRVAVSVEPRGGYVDRAGVHPFPS